VGALRSRYAVVTQWSAPVNYAARLHFGCHVTPRRSSSNLGAEDAADAFLRLAAESATGVGEISVSSSVSSNFLLVTPLLTPTVSCGSVVVTSLS
jgi:hypothetical protein